MSLEFLNKEITQEDVDNANQLIKNFYKQESLKRRSTEEKKIIIAPKGTMLLYKGNPKKPISTKYLIIGKRYEKTHDFWNINKVQVFGENRKRQLKNFRNFTL